MFDRSVQRDVVLGAFGMAGPVAFGTQLMEQVHDRGLGRVRERALGDVSGVLQQLFGVGHVAFRCVGTERIFHMLTLLPTLLFHEISLLGVLKNAARTRG